MMMIRVLPYDHCCALIADRTLTLVWRMLPSLDALKNSQQKQVQTTMSSAVLRQGLEVSIAIVDPSPGTETVSFMVL